MKTWTLSVEEDITGECFLTFPPELLEATGWHEGDTLLWHDQGDGSWRLIKKESIITDGKN